MRGEANSEKAKRRIDLESDSAKPPDSKVCQICLCRARKIEPSCCEIYSDHGVHSIPDEPMLQAGGEAPCLKTIQSFLRTFNGG